MKQCENCDWLSSRPDVIPFSTDSIRKIVEIVRSQYLYILANSSIFIVLVTFVLMIVIYISNLKQTTVFLAMCFPPPLRKNIGAIQFTPSQG